jgi:endonuclease/exonuclease/phosphatase (EEP) superfamily protein YafD
LHISINGAPASAAVLCRKIAATCTAILIVLLLASALGRWIWLLDLLANFRVHLAVLLLISSAASWLCRARWLAMLGLLFVAAVAATAFPYLRARTDAVPNENPTLRLVTFNVWHHNIEISRVAKFFEQSDADVLVIEEATPMHARLLRQQLPSYRYAFLEGTSDDGTIVFSRWPLVQSQYVELVPGGARAALLQLRWHDRLVQVIGAHLHWPLGRSVSRYRNAELQALAALAANAASRPLLVAGDFNITPWSSFYREFVRDSKLADADLGQGVQASWPAVLGPRLGIRIDHCLHSQHWQTIATRTGPELGSDHLPVIADLRLRDVR